MELRKDVIYAMERMEKTTFARDWGKINEPVNYCITVKIANIEEQPNGDVYFSFIPVGLSAGYCGFGCATLRKEPKPFGLQGMTPIKEIKASPSNRWYPSPGDRGYDLMC